MQDKPVIYYSPYGYEATYDAMSGACDVVVRGFIDAQGNACLRGGPSHANDKAAYRCRLTADYNPLRESMRAALASPVVQTFHDALVDNRDLVGNIVFRNKPANDSDRRLFAAAFDAAQKIRAKMKVLNVNHLYFCLPADFFAFADCLAQSADGTFWLMFTNFVAASPVALSLVAYILCAGGYVPPSAPVRLGVWSLTERGATFQEVRNDPIAARDAVIAKLLETPF